MKTYKKAENAEILAMLGRAEMVQNVERCVIGSVLMYPELFPVARQSLTSDHFPTFSEGWEWLCNTDARLQRWSVDTFCASNTRFSAALIVSCADVDNFEASIAFLKNERDRVVLARILTGDFPYWLGDSDPAEVRANIMAILEGMRSIPTETNKSDEILLALSEISNQTTGTPTPWPDWNKKLGGFIGGQFGIVAGLPAHGKTRQTLEILLHLAKEGKPVLFCSFELLKNRIWHLCISILTGISTKRILGGQETEPITEAEKASIVQAAEELTNIPFYCSDFTETGNSWPIVSSFARRYKAEKGVQVVGLDYIQLMQTGDPQTDRFSLQKFDALSKDIAVFTKSTGMDVIAAAQFKRAVAERANQKPESAADIAESSSFERNADWVVGVWRPTSAGLIEDEEGRKYQREDSLFIVLKNRRFDDYGEFWNRTEEAGDFYANVSPILSPVVGNARPDNEQIPF